jgi:hypothetical protein
LFAGARWYSGRTGYDACDAGYEEDCGWYDGCGGEYDGGCGGYDGGRCGG